MMLLAMQETLTARLSVDCHALQHVLCRCGHCRILHVRHRQHPALSKFTRDVPHRSTVNRQPSSGHGTSHIHVQACQLYSLGDARVPMTRHDTVKQCEQETLAAATSGRDRRYSLGVFSLGRPCLSSFPSATSCFFFCAIGPRPHLQH